MLSDQLHPLCFNKGNDEAKDVLLLSIPFPIYLFARFEPASPFGMSAYRHSVAQTHLSHLLLKVVLWISIRGFPFLIQFMSFSFLLSVLLGGGAVTKEESESENVTLANNRSEHESTFFACLTSSRDPGCNTSIAFLIHFFFISSLTPWCNHRVHCCLKIYFHENQNCGTTCGKPAVAVARFIVLAARLLPWGREMRSENWSPASMFACPGH